MSTRAQSTLHVSSRRGLLIAGALTAVGGAFAVRGAFSRGGTQDGHTPSGIGGVRKGGELLIAFDGAAVATFALDPQNSGFAPHNRVMRSIFDNLTHLLPDQTVGPWLAESWTVSNDLRIFEFQLRRGVKFHDGTSFDAAALKANFERLALPGNALTSRTSLGPYQSSEILAEDRLRVTLSEPFAPFLRNLSMTKLAIVSPAAVAKYGQTFAQNPVGTGPFRFAGSLPGTEIRLERNPDYAWAPPSAAHSGPAHLEKLVFKNVPEESTRVAVLQSGQVHASDLIPAQNLAALKRDERFHVLEKELLNTNYSLALNVGKAPWDDEEIRLAVKLSLDIDAIVRIIYLGTFPRAWSPLSPSMFGSAEAGLANSWRSDPARAIQILERKGWKLGTDGVREKDGKRLTIKFVDSQGNREKRLDVVQLVRRQLAASGIALSIDSQPAGVTSSKLATNEFDLYGGASFHGDPDILRQSYVPAARTANSGNKVIDAELIEWLTQAAREADGPKRSELYRLAQRKIIEKSYCIPIYVLLYNLGISKRAHGIGIDAHGFPEFYDAWLEA
ncbi:MAG TPA: ABC transporter substrate-binding protein [Polyangiaceae bacterium]|nr:ABC transporter substrate-binding protein [Polyangiaceae bacterium]